MIREVISPDGEVAIFERKIVRANGYKCVMSFWINGYGVGSVWLYDRRGKLVIHGTIDHPLSYKEMRNETKNLGIELKKLKEATRKILGDKEDDQ